ncbi:MAG: hypothetical protein QXU40_00065 [Candidatus Pacearchaeota archaeon]
MEVLRPDMTKSEIEKELSKKGKYVQIDYLTRFLKQQSLNTDIKRFVFLKLAELYESVEMPIEAAKYYNRAAIISTSISDKINYFVREAEMYIKGSDFVKADDAVKKAIGEAPTNSKRQEIYNNIKDFYKNKAEFYEKNMKRGQAARIYEKLLEMKISAEERDEFRRRLLHLYEKLGKIKEYSELKNTIEKRSVV